MENTKTSRNWIIGWVIAFLGFPIGGLLVTLLIGRVDAPINGALGGLVAGLVIGSTQMLALRRRIGVSYNWIIATAVGMAVGVGLSVALFGTENSLNAILMRALLTGLLIGVAQWVVLRKLVSLALVWLPALTVFYTIAWFITAQVIGASVELGFVVFGASGAITFQVLTGLTLWALLRRSSGSALKGNFLLYMRPNAP